MAVDLFGDEIDEFKTALERYGVWPTTVWECNVKDRRLSALISDDGTARQTATGALGMTGAVADARPSTFNPAVASWLLNCYAPQTGVCLDPFAGGGTRAIMAAKHGLNYVGIELRAEECEAVRQRCAKCGVADKVTIVEGDACYATDLLPDFQADFLLTCPPYYNLEQYQGGAADLSMATNYADFCGLLAKAIAETYALLRPGANACWVVGLHRDSRGNLLTIPHIVTRLHDEVGFRHREEIVLAQTQNMGPYLVARMKNFDRGRRLLARTHEYAEVYRKPGGA